MKAKKEITLGKFLEACRILDEEKDIYVDGMDGIAYCGTELTEEGEKHFADALALPMYKDEKGIQPCVISHDDNDYNLLDKGEGKLQLAWELLAGMAGYCSCENWDKWFKDSDD